MKNLDLYAKIEPLIGFYEEYEHLYGAYLKILKQFDIKTILDVGCGNGTLLLHLQDEYTAEGIDLSGQMVKIAKAKGVQARQCYLHEVIQSYDALLAVADVLNYMEEDTLKIFLTDIASKLHPRGIFICDINTPHGFEDIAAGSMNADFGDKFLAVDAVYENGILETDFTLFTANAECYKKESATILQYYYSVLNIEELSPLKLIGMQDISLFSDNSDKTILIFQKEDYQD